MYSKYAVTQEILKNIFACRMLSIYSKFHETHTYLQETFRCSNFIQIVISIKVRSRSIRIFVHLLYSRFGNFRFIMIVDHWALYIFLRMNISSNSKPILLHIIVIDGFPWKRRLLFSAILYARICRWNDVTGPRSFFKTIISFLHFWKNKHFLSYIFTVQWRLHAIVYALINNFSIRAIRITARLLWFS